MAQNWSKQIELQHNKPTKQKGREPHPNRSPQQAKKSFTKQDSTHIEIYTHSCTQIELTRWSLTRGLMQSRHPQKQSAGTAGWRNLTEAYQQPNIVLTPPKDSRPTKLHFLQKTNIFADTNSSRQTETEPVLNTRIQYRKAERHANRV
jgi:hypothetical protein